MNDSEAFEASDVPALRRDLLEWIRDGRGLRFHSMMSLSAGTMLGRPEYDGNPAMMRAYAEMVVAQEAQVLADAELYYVTEEMTGIVRAAAADMPAFVPDADDFPAPAGLIVYETPLVHYDRPEWVDAVLVEDRVAADFRGKGHEEINVVACTWGPYDAGGHWRHGGVWMSFYRGRREMLANVVDDRAREDLRPGLARLVPDNECGIAFTAGPGQRRIEESLREHDRPEYTTHWAKYLLTTLLLMRQPLVYQRSEPVRRGLRRQLERAGYPARDIRIVDARPRRYTTVPHTDDVGDEQAAEATETGRKLTVRFPVRGFWRNQWYPSRGVHRPKWIDPHWRGPEDGQIVHPERVRVLRQHPSQETALASGTASSEATT